QYVALQPGGSMDNLKNGDRISFTQSAIVLENLIGRFLTQMGNDPE
ncbi:MAG TPA: outer membrane lipid asymmetry maintenance protein MlaD, partial [Gammaproteobacteria bacterium]|nr:outer membrane lipid asymmetry maintenance protein MlaD [Gammaproteobacteria bacterium]